MDSQQPPSPRPSEAPAPHPRPPEEIVDSETEKPGGIGRGGWIALGIIGITLTGLLLRSIIARRHQDKEINVAAKAETVLPSVQVISSKPAPATTFLELPGTVLAAHQTTVYARTTGYLRRWLVDIGDRVKAGQLLAEIESPEVDQQLSQAQADLAKAQASAQQARADLAKAQASAQQARADLSKARATLAQNRASLDKGRSDLDQAKANLQIARQTWQRWQFLVQEGAVTQQDADEKLATYKANLASVSSAQNTISVDQANVKAAEDGVSSSQANLDAYIASVGSSQANLDAYIASVGSSQANLQRNAVLQSFEKVTAPYTGVISARNLDSGALITAGNGNNNASLYTIAAYDILNVDVSVPGPNAPSIQIGQTAQIKVKELPQRVFLGKVIRTSSTLDPISRTLQTRMELPNPDYAIRPGMYTMVDFPISRATSPLIVPANTLVTNAGGTQVAIVTGNQTVHYQKIEIGRDYGTQAEIISGLQGNERLIVNPTTNLVEGTRVQIQQSQKGGKSDKPENAKGK